MKRNFMAAVVAVSLTACSFSHDHTNSGRYGQGIIGGEAVTDTEPIGTTTAMLIDTQKGALCTASILNSEWLLTAAHCVTSADASSLLVAFHGTFQQLAAGQVAKKDLRRVQNFQVNPKYAQTLQAIEDMVTKAKAEGRELTASDLDGTKDWGDIALVHVSGQIPPDKVTASLMPASMKLKKSDLVTVAGYGQTGSAENSSYGSLNKVDVPVYDGAWGSTEVVLDQTNGKGACHGDSGGPAYIKAGERLYLFGVTSRGMGDGTGPQCTHYAIYTNAAAYGDWISSIVGL